MRPLKPPTRAATELHRDTFLDRDADGWLLGGPNADTKRVMALGTGQRNIAAALVVANQGFSDPKVVVMVIVVAIAGLIILMPLLVRLSGASEPLRHRV